MLTFARQQPDQAQRLDLRHAVDEVLDLIRVSPPPTVQIIMNLCHNAGKAIGDRGGLAVAVRRAIDDRA